MAHRTEPDLAVLHALRLKGFAESDAVARLAGLTADEVGAVLRSLSVAGAVTRRDGRIAGWCLTPDGRARHEQRLRAEVAASGVGEEVAVVYDGFLALNEPFKEICTAWQVRDLDANVFNDHTDAEYDAAVVGRLGELHPHAVELCDRLGAALARCAPYAGRLTAAHDRVTAGEHDWLTRPLIDSYHTVWMELHEDLLLTLGRARGEADGS